MAFPLKRTGNMNFGKDELDMLLNAVKKKYGYDFTEYSAASFARRIEHFMNLHKINTIDHLRESLLGEERFFERFIEEVTVNVTGMFRDPGFYKSLAENVLTRLATYPYIKIWIAGCATGEEVYSLAILLRENNLEKRSLIYATDINQASLKIAEEGIYPIDNMQEYTMNYIKAGGRHSFSDYYTAKYNAVLIDRSLKRNVVFAAHNLAADKSFNEFHLVICRNVLIYFNQALQDKVISLFYESLARLGFLCLGNKESLLFTGKKKFFTEVDRKEKIFMKNR